VRSSWSLTRNSLQGEAVAEDDNGRKMSVGICLAIRGMEAGDTLVLVNIKHQMWFLGVIGVSKGMDGKVQGFEGLCIAWHLKEWMDRDGLCSQGVPGGSSNNASVDDRTEPATAPGSIPQVLHGHVDDGGFRVLFRIDMDCSSTTPGVQGAAVAVGKVVVLGRRSPSRAAVAHVLNVIVDGLIRPR